MRFRDYFSVKHILFATVLMGLMIFFAFRQSNNTVKVYFEQDQVVATSAKYSLGMPYDQIASAELKELPFEGDRVASAYDDETLRAGIWNNDTWGEYYIVADLDAKNCIVVTLDDGRIFVFSRKDNATTEADYQTLMGCLK